MSRFGARDLLAWADRGSTLLAAAREAIDALNVFPVPDGDTGTNLSLTWDAALEALREQPRDAGLSDASAAWAKGGLMGARGNSGVIVAQLMRAFAEEFAGSVSTADSGSTADPALDGVTDGAPDGQLLQRALARAVRLCYAGVARPVEGTILTVAAAAASGAATVTALRPAADVLAAATDAAADALAATPDLLPVLAQAGVVDAGGQGLVLILEALRGVVDPAAPADDALLATYGLAGRGGLAGRSPGGALGHSGLGHSGLAHSGHTGPAHVVTDGAFEVMYLIEVDDAHAATLRERLDALGRSVVVVGGDGLWNVHVHTDDAGPAVEAGVAVGRVFRIQITPLTPEAGTAHEGDTAHEGGTAPERGADHPGGAADTSSAPEERRVVVAVASGPALAALFETAGAHVVRGGAGARPTPEQLVAAAGRAPEVLLLPNDDDHHGAAELAAAELRTDGVAVAVLPTHAEVQGLSALAVREPSRSFTDEVVAMSAAAAATRFGAVARAERRAMTSAGICEPGQILGLVDGDIAIIGDDAGEVTSALVDRMLSVGGELVTLVCGSSPFPGRPLAEAVTRQLHRSRLDVEVSTYDGGQEHYPLLIGVE